MEVLALGPDQVCRLTGVSARQLQYWDRTAFFSPTFRQDVKRSPFARVYSFRDVVGLRALAEMRNRHHIPLQRLRRVEAVLSRRYEELWSQLVFYVVGKRVYYRDEHSLAVRDAEDTGQVLMPLELVRVEGEVRQAVAALRQRPETDQGRITHHRFVAENRPVIAGTRIPTGTIWEFHTAGYSASEIERFYPQLRPDDIAAAVNFERKRLKHAG